MITPDNSIDILSIWNNIDEHYTNKIIYDNLTIFEKAIMDNNIEHIKDILKRGENIYHDNMLCNGSYRKLYGIHPTKCHTFVCNKTSLYYALLMNKFFYCTIFELLINYTIVNSDILYHIKSIYDLFTSK